MAKKTVVVLDPFQTPKIKEPAKRKQLEVQHFQTPEMLCDFANGKDMTILSIVAYDRFQALYYYAK